MEIPFFTNISSIAFLQLKQRLIFKKQSKTMVIRFITDSLSI